MKKLAYTILISAGLAVTVCAQEKVWTLDNCMRYAVENSPKSRQQRYTNDTYKAEYQSAIASLFPSVGTSVGAAYNWGRSIDPETNTYSNTSTFNNAYSVSASLPVFDGGVLINTLRSARVNRSIGLQEKRKTEDDIALNTMQAFIDVLYYQGMVKLAGEKLAESNRALYKVRRQEELGQKSKADVSQLDAQVAADDYNLTHQQNLHQTALLSLKNYMNLPADQTIEVDTVIREVEELLVPESVDAIYAQAAETNPTAVKAALDLKQARLQHLIYKGYSFPTISLSAGISTNYFRMLSGESEAPVFKDQFKNNRGEYLSFTLNIPLFDGLYRRTNVRRARNQVRIAQEMQTETLRQLQTAVEQAVLDRDGFAKEVIQMDKQVKAIELAYQITYRKFEEGVMSSLDLQTSANTLLLSQANLLQRRLMYLVKCKLVDYYKGLPLIEPVNENKNVN